MRGNKIGLGINALLFAGAVLLYTATLNPDVQPADSGELQLAAITLGIPHPPGYPLFTMLGWLFAQLPIGSPFARVTLLSVVASAATLVLVNLTVDLLSVQSRRASQSFTGAPGVRLMRHVPGLLAALALGVSTTFWAQATTTNIRSLTAFFTALMVYATTRAYVNGREANDRGTSQKTKVRQDVALFAIAFGLGIGHHASLVFVGAVLGVLALGMALRSRLEFKGFAIAALAFAATQLVWLYLPIRDAAGARFAPGSLNTLDGLLYHLFARGFAGDMFAFAAPAYLADRLSILPTLLSFQFSLPILIAAAGGAIALIWKRAAPGVSLALAFALHLFITLTYRAPQTVEYAMPAWVILCVAFGLGLAVLRSALPISAVLSALLAVVLIRDGFDRLPSYVSLGSDRSTRAQAEGVLESVAPGAAVWSQWHQATPMWALQDIEGLRRDVNVAYVSPAGSQLYAETFAERIAGTMPVSPTYATSLFAPQFAAARVCPAPVAGLNVWLIQACPIIHTGNPAPGQPIFDHRIEVLSVQPAGDTARVGQAFNVILSWRALDIIREGDSLTLRIMRRDGRLAANADARLDPAMARDEVRSQRFALGLPLDLAPGDYDLLVGAYQAGSAGLAPLLDRTGHNFISTGPIRVMPRSHPPVSQRPAAECGSLLDCAPPELPQRVGLDYDTGMPGQMRAYTHWRLGAFSATVHILSGDNQPLAPAQALPAAAPAGQPEYMSLVFDVPVWRGLRVAVSTRQSAASSEALPDYVDGERYVPFADQMVLIGSSAWREGGQLKVDLRWLSAQPITADSIVSARLNGANLFIPNDSVPALGAVPTLKWIRGSRVVDRHVFDTGESSGALRGTVLVYDAFTQQTLPVLDERYDQGVTFGVP